MAAFTYLPLTSGGGLSNTDRYRHYLLLGGSGRKSQAGSFTIAAGFTGSLSVVVPGITPGALLLFGGHTALGQTLEHGRHHVGFGLADLTQWAAAHGQGYLTVGRPRASHHSNSKIIVICGHTGAPEVEATLTSLHADGFTINVTNAPSTDIAVAYLAMEGGGNYAVGTTTSRTSLGVQTIALPFSPSAVFFCWGQQSALGAQSAWTRFGYGAGDADAENQYVSWYGARSSDVHTDNAARWDRVISMLTDADAAGPFDPLPFSEAVLQLPGGNQFNLNWTKVDGTARYFSWFAVDGAAEVGRIVFQHSAGTPTDVPTTHGAKALIFFQNDQGLSDPSNVGDEGLNHGPLPGILGSTLGGSLALGCCDEDLGGQYLTAMQDVNRGGGPGGAQQTMRRLDGPNMAFGAVGGVDTQLANNFPRDCGRITAILQQENAWLPQIYRRVQLPQ